MKGTFGMVGIGVDIGGCNVCIRKDWLSKLNSRHFVTKNVFRGLLVAMLICYSQKSNFAMLQKTCKPESIRCSDVSSGNPNMDSLRLGLGSLDGVVPRWRLWIRAGTKCRIPATNRKHNVSPYEQRCCCRWCGIPGKAAKQL